MNWWPFSKKKRAARAGLVLEIEQDNALVWAKWPRPTSLEEEAILVRNLAMLIHSLSEGRLVHLLVQAVQIYGKQTDMTDIAQQVANLLAALRTEGREDPMVPPLRVFEVDR